MTTFAGVHRPGDEDQPCRPVAPSVAELFGEIPRGRPLTQTDGKSGVRLERVVVGGDRYVLKHLHLADDWVMRATGDLRCRAVTIWRHGWLDDLPDCLDHAIVGAAWDDTRADGRGAVLVMRDVGDALVPEGDGVLPIEQHLTVLDHLAQMHVAFWGRSDTIGLLPLSDRFAWFAPPMAEVERARGSSDAVPTQLVPEGWARFAKRAPDVAGLVSELHQDASPLVSSLAATPRTLLHGDAKAGNLGQQPDGRTILLDWAVTGIGPACADIAHYVCLNQARLPQSKEETLLAYREALERHGVDTGSWWDRQRALSLLGSLLLFGWEKALGDDDAAMEELAWWVEQARSATAYLDGAT